MIYLKINDEVFDKITEDVATIINIVKDKILIEDEMGFWYWRDRKDIRIL